MRAQDINSYLGSIQVQQRPLTDAEKKVIEAGNPFAAALAEYERSLGVNAPQPTIKNAEVNAEAVDQFLYNLRSGIQTTNKAVTKQEQTVLDTGAAFLLILRNLEAAPVVQDKPATIDATSTALTVPEQPQQVTVVADPAGAGEKSAEVAVQRDLYWLYLAELVNHHRGAIFDDHNDAVGKDLDTTQLYALALAGYHHQTDGRPMTRTAFEQAMYDAAQSPPKAE